MLNKESGSLWESKQPKQQKMNVKEFNQLQQRLKHFLAQGTRLVETCLQQDLLHKADTLLKKSHEVITLYYATYQQHIRLKNKPSIFDIKVFEM